MNIIQIIKPLVLVTLIAFLNTTLALALPSKVWVDDDYCSSCSNGGHNWAYNAFENIQDEPVLTPFKLIHLTVSFEEFARLYCAYLNR